MKLETSRSRPTNKAALHRACQVGKGSTARTAKRLRCGLALHVGGNAENVLESTFTPFEVMLLRWGWPLRRNQPYRKRQMVLRTSKHPVSSLIALPAKVREGRSLHRHPLRPRSSHR